MTREQAEQIAQCVQCQKAAYVVFSWTGSVGAQRAPLCQSCAKKFHDTYKHTPVWASVTLSTPMMGTDRELLELAAKAVGINAHVQNAHRIP